jgi:hypothetical protein
VEGNPGVTIAADSSLWRFVMKKQSGWAASVSVLLVFSSIGASQNSRDASPQLLGANSTESPAPGESVTSYEQREQDAPPQAKKTLAELRRKLAGRSFTVGYTTAAEGPLSTIAGTRMPYKLKIPGTYIGNCSILHTVLVLAPEH